MKFNKLSGKHILVTGGTGQIGSHLVEKLLTYDSKVSILCRKITSSRGIEDLVNENRISFLKCDLAKESDILKIKNSLTDVNLIVHLSFKNKKLAYRCKSDSTSILNYESNIIKFF
jgi:nucleoside-diphosphate-sugar epimerase